MPQCILPSPLPESSLAFSRAAAQFFQSDRNAHALSVTQNAEHDFRAGLFLSDHHLKFAGVADFLAVDFGDDVADLQAGFGSGRIGFDLRDHASSRRRLVEELRVLRSHVGDPDADVAMADFAVANQASPPWA